MTISAVQSRTAWRNRIVPLWFEVIGERAPLLSQGSRLLALQAELELAILGGVGENLAVLNDGTGSVLDKHGGEVGRSR